MKGNKDIKRLVILKASYRLLLHKCYKDITFSDLEDSTGLTRGSVYYYFENKRCLFEEVIRSFYLSHFYNYNLSCLISGRFTPADLRKSYKCPFERIVLGISASSEDLKIDNPARSFFHFTIQASTILPGFDEEVRILLDRESETLKTLVPVSCPACDEKELDRIIKEIYDASYLRIFKSAFLQN